MLEVRRLCVRLLVLLLWISLSLAQVNDTALLSPGTNSPSTNPEDPWDLLFWSNVQQTCNDELIFGVTFAGSHFYVSGSGGLQGPWDNHVYRLTTTGVLDTVYQQPPINGYGFRDLTYDGVYLYGAADSILYAFNLDGHFVHSQNVLGPINPCRALAYDPATDHFWTGSFSETAIYEFDRSGQVMWSGATTLTGIYGMAWDETTAGGPWLWIFDQSGPNYNQRTTIRKFNPATHQLTGYSYVLSMLPGLSSQIAGGSEITSRWIPDVPTLVGIAQGTPFDALFVLEMNSPIPLVRIALSPLNPPIVIPASGGDFDYHLEITNSGAAPATFQSWIDVIFPSGSVHSSLVGPFSLVLPSGGSLDRMRSQTVPAAAPTGQYTYIGFVGTYPVLVYDSSYFSFRKAHNSSGSEAMATWWDGTEYLHQKSEDYSSEELNLRCSPNPFNATTMIEYAISTPAHYNLSIYDLTGRQVVNLIDDYHETGSHQVKFDGANLAAGVYVYRLSTYGQISAGKVILLK